MQSWTPLYCWNCSGDPNHSKTQQARTGKNNIKPQKQSPSEQKRQGLVSSAASGPGGSAAARGHSGRRAAQTQELKLENLILPSMQCQTVPYGSFLWSLWLGQQPQDFQRLIRLCFRGKTLSAGIKRVWGARARASFQGLMYFTGRKVSFVTGVHVLTPFCHLFAKAVCQNSGFWPVSDKSLFAAKWEKSNKNAGPEGTLSPISSIPLQE